MYLRTLSENVFSPLVEWGPKGLLLRSVTERTLSDVEQAADSLSVQGRRDPLGLKFSLRAWIL